MQLIVDFARILNVDEVNIREEWAFWSERIVLYAKREKRTKIAKIVEKIDTASMDDGEYLHV